WSSEIEIMLLIINRCVGVFHRNTLNPSVLSLTECHSSLISNPSRCSVGDSRTSGRGGCPAGGLELRPIGQRALKLVLEVADSQEAADPAQELDLVDGLGQEVVGPGLHAALESAASLSAV